MEFAVILLIVFAFVLTKNVFEQRARIRERNLQLLETALQNPAIDRATLESLTQQLTGRRAPRDGTTPWMAFVLSVGWIALFVGIGIAVVGGVFNDDDATMGGVVASVAGFGLVTWPFALRELEARRQPQ